MYSKTSKTKTETSDDNVHTGLPAPRVARVEGRGEGDPSVMRWFQRCRMQQRTPGRDEGVVEGEGEWRVRECYVGIRWVYHIYDVQATLVTTSDSGEMYT